MLVRIRQLLAPPVFEDEEKMRVVRLLNTVLLACFAGVVLVLISVPLVYGFLATPEDTFTLLSGVVVGITILVLLILARRGRTRIASAVLLSMLWLIITIWIFAVSGIRSDSSPLAYPLIIVLAGLLLGGRAAVAFTLISVLAIAGAYYAEADGLLVVVKGPLTLMDPLMTAIPIILTGVLLRHAVNSMLEALERARRNERAQAEANRALETLRASLEQRVADRTYDLERRSLQLQAAAEVSRAATSILEPEQLIWQVAGLIQERFDLYHVGLFQLDATGQWAEYRAGAGQGSQALAEQGFRLEVGGASMVGWCTTHAQTRVAQDVSAEPRRVDHPLVTKTRSEAALPLIAHGQVVGALSVQSSQPGAFDPDTVAALQTMADQVAVALDNARLFVESQEALEGMRRAYSELSRQAWLELLRTRVDWGYQCTRQSIDPAEGDWEPEMLLALQTGQTVRASAEGQGPQSVKGGDGSREPVLAIPLKVRDEVVGVLGFYKDAGRSALPAAEGSMAAGPAPSPAQWMPEETRLLERLVHQMGLALESAQFYEDSQRRAVREQTAREITARMRETMDMDTVLRTAAQEVRKALGLPEVVVRLRRAAHSSVTAPQTGETQNAGESS